MGEKMSSKEEKTPQSPPKKKKNTTQKPEKNLGGRPTKVDWEDEEVLEQVAMLAGMGFTEQDIADYHGINSSTLRRNKAKYERLCTVIKKGRKKAVGSVSSMLYNKAKGGNVTAMIFFLKNRAPELWSDTQRLEHSGSIEVERKLERLITFVNKSLTSEQREKMFKELEKAPLN